MVTTIPTMPLSHRTLVPFSNFSASADATLLRNSLKSDENDKDAVVKVITTRTNSQRQQIKAVYKQDFQRDLVEDLKSELSGHFKHAVKVMFMQPAEYDAYSLHKAMKGLGKLNLEILKIGEIYKKTYGRLLAHSLMNETSGDFQKLCLSANSGSRSTSVKVHPTNAHDDARRLYRAGEKKVGTDESVFISIMTSQSFPYLRLVFAEYQKIAKRDIIDSIKSEFSGNMKDGMISVVEMVRNAPSYFAKKLHDCMHGAGTKDTDLIRIIVSRSEIDMLEIKKEFQALYNKSLAECVKGDTSGGYKNILLTLIGH